MQFKNLMNDILIESANSFCVRAIHPKCDRNHVQTVEVAQNMATIYT